MSVRKGLLFIGLSLLVSSALWANPANENEGLSDSLPPHQEEKTPSAKIQKDIRVMWGVKAEFNSSHFLVYGLKQAFSRPGSGSTLGAVLHLNLMKHMAMEFNMLFHYKTSEFYVPGMAVNHYRYCGMEIPIYLMAHWRFGKGHRLYAGGGPYTEFGFSAKSYINDLVINLYEKIDGREFSAIENTNSGFGVLVGFEFAWGLGFQVGYKISASDMLSSRNGRIHLYPDTFSMGLSYRFVKH